MSNVAFGCANQLIYKSLNGSFICNEATFGGRIAGGVNTCKPVPCPKGQSPPAETSVITSPDMFCYGGVRPRDGPHTNN
ncbi:hypothetical protein GCM10025770_18530 [Viridibacterium curvum]|uniref:Uncharacterized protein n=1 Tax=Viridibacterium curvum TaxID=1101404 RepID=A0ABP9QN57_9RHOO